MLKAFLVSFHPMTRVVIDVAGEELTDDELAAAVRKARSQMTDDISDYLTGDTLDEIVDDIDCPYGTLPTDK